MPPMPPPLGALFNQVRPTGSPRTFCRSLFSRELRSARGCKDQFGRGGVVYTTMEPGDPHNVHVHWLIENAKALLCIVLGVELSGRCVMDGAAAIPIVSRITSERMERCRFVVSIGVEMERAKRSRRKHLPWRPRVERAVDIIVDRVVSATEYVATLNVDVDGVPLEHGIRDDPGPSEKWRRPAWLLFSAMAPSSVRRELSPLNP